MENYPVDLYFVREKGSPSQADQYYLHAITHTNRTDYRANGHAPVPSVLTDDGVLEIELYIQKDNNVLEFGFPTPVVHTISLNAPPFDGQSPPRISVNVSLEASGEPKKKIGESTTSNVRAAEDSRPLAPKAAAGAQNASTP
ncbi:MAG: hypothetical protein AAFV25_17190 [Bacteroidota bacterium]